MKRKGDELKSHEDAKILTAEEVRASQKHFKSVHQKHKASLSPLDRLAVAVTDRVGTMGFFLLIFVWTVLWTGYNLLASIFPNLHWKAFDPFPAFVAYLLISNVIQILLMPLIMVGQNLQGRHSEMRAEHDLAVNIKAEKEVETILMHLERQQTLLVLLAEAQGIKLDEALSKSGSESH